MSATVAIDVVPRRLRVGCKGPEAEQWLAGHGVLVPSGANRYEIDSSGLLVARLATSEFLLEGLSVAANDKVARIREALEHADYPSTVYPVLRQDFVVEIAGPKIQPFFLETCAIDLEPVARESTEAAGPVILTTMIGVNVVLICRRSAAGPRFTVWSDPSYSAYFYSQLTAIAAELAQGAGSDGASVSPIRSGGPYP